MVAILVPLVVYTTRYAFTVKQLGKNSYLSSKSASRKPASLLESSLIIPLQYRCAKWSEHDPQKPQRQAYDD